MSERLLDSSDDLQVPMAKADAQTRLGLMYFHGQEEDQSDSVAFQNFQQAAEQGHIVGMGNLCFMYDLGRGIGQNDTLAATWYERAAKKVLPHFRGVTQDVVGNESCLLLRTSWVVGPAFWFQQAAQQGYMQAQNHLGKIYELGRGVSQDGGLAAHGFTRRPVILVGYVFVLS